MRIYVYEPQHPGYIEAEIAVEDYDWQGVLEGRWSRTSLQSLGGFARSRKLLTREELLTEPGGREALEAWPKLATTRRSIPAKISGAGSATREPFGRGRQRGAPRQRQSSRVGST